MSLLGLVGACTQKKRWLAPYTLLLFVCLAVQMVGLVHTAKFNAGLHDAQALDFNEKNYNSVTSSAMDWIKKNTENVFDQAQCSLSTPQTTGDVVMCTADNSQWFEKFVNTKCSSNMARCDATSTDQAAIAFCLCQNALTDELKQYSNPILIAYASLVIFELLLVIFAICLCCIGRRNRQRQPRCNLDERLHQQPEAQFNYVHHSSVPPGARGKAAGDATTADCVAVSQAINLV